MAFLPGLPVCTGEQRNMANGIHAISSLEPPAAIFSPCTWQVKTIAFHLIRGVCSVLPNSISLA